MTGTTRNHWLAAARPRSFTGLMALYESNYRRFERLVPEVDLPFQFAESRGADNWLYLRVLERCRYTTTVHLTHWFEFDGELRPDPDLRLRLYGDAGLVEAIYCDQRSRYAALAGLPAIDQSVVAHQWPRNLMLNKWLAYCLAQGHSFGGAHRPRSHSTEAAE
ncbi:DUF1249 domain-containing protein [Salinisphaera sp. USBA-960]|uniref:DUF1249 domain-containing protein n=1 Tax=Salinisphaera orenii TaxID=856731 RepID=UPI000DBEA64E|nr:DUF1249 domain-containing protein [Salifodinibacter halophilus]NNC25813.1 DUF1249 domain-containing protein [Salifodinibacter halophilus]